MKKGLLLLISVLAVNPLFMAHAQADAANTAPDLASKAAIMMDAETGDVLYEKQAGTEMYPASLTKIATAIYVIETADLDEMAVVSEKAANTGGSSVYLEKGEHVTLGKLIRGLLINSGNDAGVAIAEHVSGGVRQFASNLNSFLQTNIGVQNTHFENPHGLFNSNHTTTAEDLAKITQYAIRNQLFREIFGTVEMPWHGESWDTTLRAHHKFMTQQPYEGVTGGKTGYVNKSGFTLATTAKRDGLNLIVITLNTDRQAQAYEDTRNLLDYGFTDFEHAAIDKGRTFETGSGTYITPKSLTYTQKKDEKVTKAVNEEGMLKLRSPNGEVLSSFPLEKVEQENAPKPISDSGAKDNTAPDSKSGTGGVIPVIVTLTGLLSIAYVYKRKRERNSM